MIDVGTGKPIWALGLMTGTSMDGVDAATILTDGETVSPYGSSYSGPLSSFTEGALREVVADPDRYFEPKTQADFEGIQEFHSSFLVDQATAVMWVLRGCGDDFPELVGLHGQTIVHRPDEGFTWQLGHGPEFAKMLNRPVVSDFRLDDIKQGGQGAPLAPFYHFALARWFGADAPLAFLNIGGVGNVTWIDPSKSTPEEPGALIAFDTGPGNALVNDWMRERTGAAQDTDGAAAANGTIHRDRLSSNSGQAYLDRPGPKSLDRNDFHGVLAAMEGLSITDGAATLTAFTADCVAASVRHMPSPPTRWLVCGGGRHNATMMRMLADRLEAPVEPVEAVGLDGDMLEAQAFAYLAVRVLRGLPTSAPSTTGCREPVCGGSDQLSVGHDLEPILRILG